MINLSHIDKKDYRSETIFKPLPVLAETGNGINLLFEVEDFASSQNCEMEVERNHLYSLEVRPNNHV